MASSSDRRKFPFSVSERARASRAVAFEGSSSRTRRNIRAPSPACPAACRPGPGSGGRRAGGAPAVWLSGAEWRSRRAASAGLVWRPERNRRRRAFRDRTNASRACWSASSSRPCWTSSAAFWSAARRRRARGALSVRRRLRPGGATAVRTSTSAHTSSAPEDHVFGVVAPGSAGHNRAVGSTAGAWHYPPGTGWTRNRTSTRTESIAAGCPAC